MSRQPKFTPEEAEALIGPRGETSITSANRAPCRQWLAAMGVPSALVAKMTNGDLDSCYNDTSNKTLNGFKKAAADYTETNASDSVVSNKSNSLNDDGSAGATLAKLVSPYLTDEIMNTVIERVDAILANVSVTRIECVRQDGSEHVIEGHVHPKFPLLLKIMASRMANGLHPNVMICGPTGSGKTHAVNAACKALGIDFETNGALTMDYQVLGFKDAAGAYHDTAFRRAYSKACGYLFDEIDASDNNPLICLAGALANHGQTFPDGFITRHPDSRIIAAGNTWGLGPTAEFVGRARLDGMIRSRFPIRLHWGYDEELEQAICGNPAWARRVQRARAKASAAGMHVIIDPRMSQAGAALLAQGLDETVVAELTYLANLDADQRRIVEGA